MELRPLISKRVSELSSPIRDIIAPARKLEAAGKKMYYFNIGDPNRFDFDTPAHLREALKREIDNRTGHYSDSEGKSALRKKLAEVEGKKAGIDADAPSIVVTVGLSEAMLFLMGSLLEEGDEVLLPSPVYPPYMEYARFFGGKIVTYDCVEEKDWAPDVEQIRSRITKRTKAIFLINPNNPTGAVYPEKTMRKIIEIASDAGVPVIADEIYDKMIFGNVEYSPAAKISGDRPIVILNGFSKNFLAPGWRLGYMYFHNPGKDARMAELEEACKKLSRVRLSASTPLQRALISAWDNSDHFEEIRRKLSERADVAYTALNRIPGISARKPAGAFYIFPKVDLSIGGWKTDKEFVLDQMRETGLVVVNGEGFGCPAHFRSVILPEPRVLEEAFGKLESYMRAKAEG